MLWMYHHEIVCVLMLVRKRKQEEEEAEQKKRATEAAYQGEIYIHSALPCWGLMPPQKKHFFLNYINLAV